LAVEDTVISRVFFGSADAKIRSLWYNLVSNSF